MHLWDVYTECKKKEHINGKVKLKARAQRISEDALTELIRLDVETEY